MENRTENRVNWDDYFLGIAAAVAKRSECLDKQVGCVIVDVNNRILGTGYNGMPPGVACPCTSECIKDRTEQPCPMVHAELNAMLYSDMSRAYAVYCTLEPCTNCRRHIDACGVQRVVVARPKVTLDGSECTHGMTISTLFQQIAIYHRALGYPTPGGDVNNYTQERELLLALSQEVAELTDSYPWKPWRPIASQPWDRPNTIEEMVDILFFLGALMELGNISVTEICDTFGKKLKENYSRIQRGYNKEMK